jgi:hypothetical protein
MTEQPTTDHALAALQAIEAAYNQATNPYVQSQLAAAFEFAADAYLTKPEVKE